MVSLSSLIALGWLASVVLLLILRNKSRQSFKRECVIASYKRLSLVAKWTKYALGDPHDQRLSKVREWSASLVAADQSASRDWLWDEARELVHKYEKNFEDAVDEWVEKSSFATNQIREEWAADKELFSALREKNNLSEKRKKTGIF